MQMFAMEIIQLNWSFCRLPILYALQCIYRTGRNVVIYARFNIVSIDLLMFTIRITNDAREDEMEDNMGQVNTMIGN